MRHINVQIHPERIDHGSTDELIHRLQAAADGVVLELRGQDRGDDYISLSFVAADHLAAWSRLRDVYDSSEIGQHLARSTIVVCEGDHGWDDYLLLHHFDPAQKLDDVG